MKLNNIKDLEAIIELCRKRGVESIEIDGVKLHLTPKPVQRRAKRNQTTTTTEDIPTSESVFSEDETLFWSSAGMPTDGAN